MPTRPSTSSARVAGLLPARAAVQPQRLGDLRADRSWSGSARSAGPGRPCRCRCRGPAQVRARPAATRSVPSNRIAAAGDPAAGRQQPRTTARSSSCRSRTRRRGPRVSPGATLQRDAVDGVHDRRSRAAGCRRAQVRRSRAAARPLGRSPASPRRSRTSNASRSPSPMKLKATHDQHDRDARREDQPPVAVVGVVDAGGQHGAPVGRGRRDAQAEEAERWTRRGSRRRSGRCTLTMTVPIAFGTMCRSTTRGGRRPSPAPPARTRGCAARAPRRAPAGPAPARRTAPMTKISISTDALKRVATNSRRNRAGIASSASTMRIMIASTSRRGSRRSRPTGCRRPRPAAPAERRPPARSGRRPSAGRARRSRRVGAQRVAAGRAAGWPCQRSVWIWSVW